MKVASRVAEAFHSTTDPTRAPPVCVPPACTPNTPAQPPTPATCCACCTAPTSRTHLRRAQAWLTNNPTLTIQGRVLQVHASFRQRTTAHVLATAAPLSSPWLSADYVQNFRQAA